MAGNNLDDGSGNNDSDLFYLKWHNFQKNVTRQFERLREEDDLVDITFACEGKQIRAHKLVLFACSPYFKQLLKTNPCKHPVFYMNDVKFEILKSILEYMYLGEVHISNDNLTEFIRVAEGLKIRGLAKGGKESTPPVVPPTPAPGSHQQLTNTTNTNNNGVPSSNVSMEHFDDFDSEISQQSVPNAESTKRMKLSECFEGIAGSNETSNNPSQQQQQQQQHQTQQQLHHLNHQQQQQQQHHHHHSHHQSHHQQQQQGHSHHHLATATLATTTATSNHQQQQQYHHDNSKRSSENKQLQALEPKVEMVEFMETTTSNATAPTVVSVQHSVPPPAYCQMQPSLVITTSGGGGGDKGTLTLATSADNNNALLEDAAGKLQQQQQQLIQQHLQQAHHQNNNNSNNNSNAANVVASAWLTETTQTNPTTTSLTVNKVEGSLGLDTSSTTQSAGSAAAIQQEGSPNVSVVGEEKSGGSNTTKSGKKQANCLNPHPCPVCARVYSNVSNLRQHMRLIHHRMEVCCPVCQKNFNSQLYLKRHYTSVHGFPPGTLIPTGEVGAGAGTAANSGGGGGGRRSEEGKGTSSSNNNSAGQTNGGTGWSLYEMENSSSGNMCQ